MKEHQSSLRSGQQLTPELFDFYVDRARAERAKAIAEFGSSLIGWLRGLACRGRRGVRGDAIRARSRERRSNSVS